MIASLLLTVAMSQSPAHLGPIPSPRAKVSVGPGRVEGKAVMPKMSPPSNIGKWIWTEGEPSAVRFLKKIECAEAPERATIRVTSECSYRLYVNGQIVSRGPADVGRDYDLGPTGPWLYDVIDVKPWMRKGANAIGVEVVSQALVQSEGRLGKPGLWLEADVDKLRIGSDESWLASPSPSLGFQAAKNGEPLFGKGVFLTLRGDASSGEWLQGGGDGFRPATLAKNAERPILQSEIPAPMEAIYPSTGYTRVHGGVTVAGKPRITAPGGLAVRFDRVLSAHIVLRVNGGAGSVITLMPNERDSEGYNRAVRLVLGEGHQTFEVPFFDSFSTINIEATGVSSPIEIEEVRAVFRSYPVRYRGEFECNDAALNETWKAGRWSTQICMQTHHLDSPHHQEPISDPGDYLIESLISYNVFGEAGLARQDLRKYAQIIRDRKSKVFHTSYALLWLQMLVEYWQHTGDQKLIEELAPTAYALVDTWETWRGPNGLISNPPNFMFIDWVEIEGFNLHHPPSVIGQGVLTAFYYRALDDIAAIAELLGDQTRKGQSMERRASIREAFNRELWSSSKRLYRDGKPGQSQSPVGTWLPADKPIETFSSQVNILACAYGLAPENEARNVLQKVMESGPANCQPYFMHFAFDALDRTGLYNEWATRQMRRWKLVPDTQTFTEMWDRGDYSHAWQCTPTYQMSARVLGVSPQAPGYRQIRIQPSVCDLKWAKGSIPTPRGNVKVSWERDDDKFQLRVQVPRGAKATVILPDSTAREVGPGSHSFRCSLLGGILRALPPQSDR